MIADEIKIQYIGGPTVLLEVAGLRIITDPTFDAGNTDYKTPYYTLHKSESPLINVTQLGKVDFVLLSHDHHFDNLDNSGRSFLSKVEKVFTTSDAEKRLKGNAVGLETWQTVEVPTKDKRVLQITGTPCRHGPANGDRGPVTGFILRFKDEQKNAVYITGDTVWYEGVEEVAKRFNVRLALVFMGAAIVKEVGTEPLTMTAGDAVLFAKQFEEAKIVPLHYEGWKHLSESRKEIENAFQRAGLAPRLQFS